MLFRCLLLLLLLQRWLKNGGFTGGPAIEVDLSEPTPELMGTLVRFMQWWAAGRPGDPVKERRGGRKVGGDVPRSLQSARSLCGWHRLWHFYVHFGCCAAELSRGLTELHNNGKLVVPCLTLKMMSNAGGDAAHLQASKDAPKLKGVHAAMQELVKRACNAAGTTLYHLRQQVSATRSPGGGRQGHTYVLVPDMVTGCQSMLFAHAVFSERPACMHT
jgi:hypothetical protein